MDRYIKKIFTDPKSPACFSSGNRVFNEVRKKFPSVTRDRVEQILEKENAYSLHRSRRIRFKRLKTIPLGFMTDLQVDLADMQKIADKNTNFKFMLVGIDVLSRRMFAAPTKSEASNHMIAAFKRLFRQMPMLPYKIFSDKGTEFEAASVKKFLKDQQIEKHKAQSPDVKAAVAERAIRTIKGRLYKYFTNAKTKRWIDVLLHIVDSINNSKSRVIGMKPIDVNLKNADELWERIYGESARENRILPQATRYNAGDKVRIAKQKGQFEKSYVPNYTQEKFKIKKIRQGKPQTYLLEDEKGEDIVGKFYNPELSRVLRKKYK